MPAPELMIKLDGKPFLRVDGSQFVLLPTKEDERSAAVEVLTQALALLAGIDLRSLRQPDRQAPSPT